MVHLTLPARGMPVLMNYSRFATNSVRTNDATSTTLHASHESPYVRRRNEKEEVHFHVLTFSFFSSWY
jgi:hypothetical protein